MITSYRDYLLFQLQLFTKQDTQIVYIPIQGKVILPGVIQLYKTTEKCLDIERT